MYPLDGQWIIMVYRTNLFRRLSPS
jgi:hypothetical protein